MTTALSPMPDDSDRPAHHQQTRPAAAHLAPILASTNPEFQRDVAQLDRFARRGDQTVLLVGESGCGKSVFAEQLHRWSPRASNEFHTVPLTEIDDALGSSDLFGHVRGAFTSADKNRAGCFAAANGGTLFLDEIGKASALTQARLLNVVDRREFRPVGADRKVRVDVRIVCATNVPLGELVLEGTFLPDLRMRLEGSVIRVRSLRERRCDVAQLALHFVERHHEAYRYPKLPALHPALMDALVGYDWPGNVRELEQAICRLLIDADGASRITMDHARGLLAAHTSIPRRPTQDEILAELRRQETPNISAIARKFGVSRTTIHGYLKCAAAIATTVATDLAL